MPQIFHRSATPLSKLSLAGLLIVVASGILFAMIPGWSPHVTRAHELVEQPVQFSHRHHVRDDLAIVRNPNTELEPTPAAATEENH